VANGPNIFQMLLVRKSHDGVLCLFSDVVNICAACVQVWFSAGY